MSDRDGAPYRLRAAMRAFTERDIELPKAVHDAAAVVDRIEAQIPAEPLPTDLRDAVLDNASADKIDALVLRQLGFQLRRTAYMQGELTVAQRALAAISAAANDIHAQLKSRAEAIIERLTAVAAIGEVTLDALIRQGRGDEAKVLASKEVDAAELDTLYDLNRLIFAGAEFGVRGVDCSQFADPASVNAYGAALADKYVSALANGATLHFPTPVEAIAAATPVARRLEREHAEAVHNRLATHGV